MVGADWGRYLRERSEEVSLPPTMSGPELCNVVLMLNRAHRYLLSFVSDTLPTG